MSRIGFLADDLTGAADVLAQAHARGLDAALSLDPTKPLPDAADVVGIAGPSRSLAGDALEAAVRAGIAPFAAADLDVFLYKICSTFDSSPTVGNIGRAIEILHEQWPSHGAIAVAPAQPEFGRYTAFSQHFGAYRGEVHRLDRHPVMSRHPATPMHEADLRAIIASQQSGDAPIAAIHLPAYTDGTFSAEWKTHRRESGSFVVDAVAPDQMDAVADALLADGHVALVVGSGGIMAALARRRARGERTASAASVSSGPTLAVSASASSTTADQIAHAVGEGWVEVAIPGDAFTQDRPSGAWVDATAAALADGRNVIAHTLRGTADPRMLSGTVDSAAVGGAIGRLAKIMVERGLTRDVAIFGGDSSSHALLALGVTELRVSEQFVTAGPICQADAASAVAESRLLLKGGQVGPVDILSRFVGNPTSSRGTS
ncbi:four-carbon acid sugar kinase family protein [Microbacterium sp. NPDC079995]|uniref:four-carbon acid sugar kinase family protein n=1 Tax=unclassified Microbacterium TaxID=2609290 RepID=UPI00344D1E30